MNTQRLLAPTLRTASAAALAAGGYIHAQLYADEYRCIHIIGPLFLLQASTSLALAALLLMGTPPLLLRAAAAGITLGALAGFTASRTVGIFGFTEHGLLPTPQALLSLLTETGTLLLLATWQMTVTRQHRAAPNIRQDTRPGPGHPAYATQLSDHRRAARDASAAARGGAPPPGSWTP